MACQVKMAYQEHLDHQVTKGMWESKDMLDHKVHLARLVSQDHQGPMLDLPVDSCSSFIVSQTENHFVHRGCQNYGLAIVCCTWKDKRKLTIKILVWQDLVFLYLIPCPLLTVTSTKFVTMPAEMISPTGCQVPLPYQ